MCITMEWQCVRYRTQKIELSASSCMTVITVCMTVYPVSYDLHAGKFAPRRASDAISHSFGVFDGYDATLTSTWFMSGVDVRGLLPFWLATSISVVLDECRAAYMVSPRCAFEGRSNCQQLLRNPEGSWRPKRSGVRGLAPRARSCDTTRRDSTEHGKQDSKK